LWGALSAAAKWQARVARSLWPGGHFQRFHPNRRCPRNRQWRSKLTFFFERADPVFQHGSVAGSRISKLDLNVDKD